MVRAPFFLLAAAIFLSSCKSRDYNQPSQGLSLVVEKYEADKVTLPADDLVAAARRVASVREGNGNTFRVRGLLRCEESISGQSKCEVNVGRNSAEVAPRGSAALMTKLKAQLKITDLEWSLRAPFEAEMDLGNKAPKVPEAFEEIDPAPAKDEGVDATLDEPPSGAWASTGLRVNYKKMIPPMEKLKTKAGIKGNFLEAKLRCMNGAKPDCVLLTEDGAFSEPIPEADGIDEGLRAEWLPFQPISKTPSKTLFEGKVCLYVKKTQEAPAGYIVAEIPFYNANCPK